MLGSWYYRDVCADDGPIAKISVRQLDGVDPNQKWEAMAYLKEGHIQRGRHLEFKIYGLCDGGGTSASRATACHIAVSEALERWAWAASSREPSLRSTAGLDLDPSTNGWAAYPGPFSNFARQRAYLEAVERWSLVAWWNGQIGHEPLPNRDGAIRLLLPMPDAAVVILTQKIPRVGYTYGFAGGSDISAAHQRAYVELLRNIHVLTKWAEKNAIKGTAELPTTLHERRLLYFSGDEGHARFVERLGQRRPSLQISPEVLVDRRISGCWDKYCRVWRVLFKSAFNHTTAIDQFLF